MKDEYNRGKKIRLKNGRWYLVCAITFYLGQEYRFMIRELLNDGAPNFNRKPKSVTKEFLDKNIIL